MMVNMLGCFSEKTTPRPRTVSIQTSLQLTRDLHMSSVRDTIRKRATHVDTQDATHEGTAGLRSAVSLLTYRTMSRRKETRKKWEKEDLRGVGSFHGQEDMDQPRLYRSTKSISEQSYKRVERAKCDKDRVRTIQI